MREAETDKKTATVIVAVLAFLGVLSFAFAGVSIIASGTSTAASTSAVAPHNPG
ncbi:MAG TPA: hypothetical protein VLW88_13040 [Hyphomicrobium sp.]|jgi:hypothetical protein|nr:hypothetical protein [Hyphomicrobium sp.]